MDGEMKHVAYRRNRCHFVSMKIKEMGARRWYYHVKNEGRITEIFVSLVNARTTRRKKKKKI